MIDRSRTQPAEERRARVQGIRARYARLEADDAMGVVVDAHSARLSEDARDMLFIEVPWLLDQIGVADDKK